MKAVINKSYYYIFFVLVLFAIGGCKKDDTTTNPQTPAANEVLMQSNTFSPATMTVTAGTTVTWTNKDSYNHTVTSGAPGTPDGKFDSGNIGANGTFSFKFDTKGTYAYYCKIHSMMIGTIIVQ